MEHVGEIRLLDYVAGRLGASESQQVRRHIAECKACASRCREATETWNTLGHWQIDSLTHQVADRIEALAAEREPGRKVLISFGSSAAAALRIAAAVILAAGGGHLLGRYSGPPNTPQPAAPDEGPRYVAALGFEWSSGLTWAVLEEDNAGGVNQQ
ncbi:MAG: zf-HC2 domain-containing protein [Phycisphaerales bacterium]|nr:MAG: zf-HC2 domain-containing protein [Phycisphaerales bacterium]